MVYVFLSDCYNHHQSAFSEAMYELTDGNYYFIATKPLSANRKKLGWLSEKTIFLKNWYNKDEKDECEKLIDSADVVITGSAPEALLKNRIYNGKLVIRYSERLYKDSYHIKTWPARLFKYAKMFNHKNMFLLCASAYSANDFALTFNFLRKAYKWGYFPEMRKYDDIRKVIENKHAGSLLWCARLIDWKHPELPILLAKRLKEDGYKFEINMLGNGEMEQGLKEKIATLDLSDCVHMLGSVSPQTVREYMEQSQIFLFTSDRNEGWGAVLNESMNSGCAIVADHAIGAVPFMVESGKNGLVYEDGNFESFYSSVKKLLEDSALCVRLGEAAYQTICDAWNAREAAERLLLLIDDFKRYGKSDRYIDGPCSIAKPTKSRWYI